MRQGIELTLKEIITCVFFFILELGRFRSTAGFIDFTFRSFTQFCLHSDVLLLGQISYALALLLVLFFFY